MTSVDIFDIVRLSTKGAIMIHFIACISLSGFSKDYGPATSASWLTLKDFVNYARLMGATASQIEEFNKTGSLSFICSDQKSSSITRYSYVLDESKNASELQKRQKHNPCSRESIQITTMNYLSPSNRLRM